MAKRVGTKEVSEDNPAQEKSLEEVFGDEKQLIGTDKEGNTKRISTKEAKEKKLKDYKSVTPNQTDTEDGSVKEKYLKKDLKLVKKYFIDEFRGVKSRGLVVDPNLKYFIIKKFPLPDYFVDKNGRKRKYKPDYEDMLFIIDRYPQTPPYGIHVKEDSNNKKLIKEALGHSYKRIMNQDPNYQSISDDLEKRGWGWICFHYAGGNWNFNRNDIERGDNLFKYIESLFAFLSGGF